MAQCPECGGGLRPSHLLRLRGSTVKCRWCGARVRLSPLARFVRDALVVVLATIGATHFASLYLDTADTIFIGCAFLVVVGSLLIGLLVEWCSPMQTVIPRDVSPWKKRRRSRMGESVDDVRSEESA